MQEKEILYKRVINPLFAILYLGIIYALVYIII